MKKVIRTWTDPKPNHLGSDGTGPAASHNVANNPTVEMLIGEQPDMPRPLLSLGMFSIVWLKSAAAT